MKKRLLIIVPALVFGLSTLSHAGNGINEKQPASVSVDVNQNISEAVKQQLNDFLNLIPVNAEKDFGFNSRSEFAQAVPATIYRSIGVDKDGNTFQTNLYNVVVAVNNSYRAVLSVSLNTDGKYEIQTAGAAPLAKELQALEQQYPLLPNYERIMVDVFTKAASFVAYNEVNAKIENANLIPLESAKTALKNEEGRALLSSYKFSEAIEALELK
jgi:hypothetical protein